MRLSVSALTLLLSLYLQDAQAKINWDIFEHGVVDTFKWSAPFPDDGTDPNGFHVQCRAEREFHAKMYRLKDLTVQQSEGGLAPWQAAIGDFLNKRDYMGSWDGVDHKGDEREIVVMEYKDVPLNVRRWIEEQQRDEENEKKNQYKWMFGVFQKPKEEGEYVRGTVKPPPGDGNVPVVIPDQDKILVFPAGAIYENLPLWVASGSPCEHNFNDLSHYRPMAQEHSVIAWVTDHTKPDREHGKRSMTFRIKAMSGQETDDAKRARLMWEKMHRTIKRQERRMQKEERQRKRKEMEEQHPRDEL